MKRRILIYGHDSSLLDTRASLVRSAGFDVICAYKRSDLEPFLGGDPFDAIIVCHTVSAEENQALLLMVQSLQPQMKVLALNANQREAFFADGVESFDVWRGPEALIASLENLLAGT